MTFDFSSATKRSAIVLMIFAAISGARCSSQQANQTVAVAQSIIGEVWTEAEGSERRNLATGDALEAHEVLHTGADGIAIIQFRDNVAELEMHENAKVHINKFSEEERELELARGNLWLRVNDENQGKPFALHSPTAIAGVRGTKFFTFQFGDVHGTCHCQGSVHYEVKGQAYQQHHDEDFVVVTRGNTTALVTPDDLRSVLGDEGFTDHRHSRLPDSPLGPSEAQMSAEDREALFKLINDKLDEAEQQ